MGLVLYGSGTSSSSAHILTHFNIEVTCEKNRGQVKPNFACMGPPYLSHSGYTYFPCSGILVGLGVVGQSGTSEVLVLVGIVGTFVEHDVPKSQVR